MDHRRLPLFFLLLLASFAVHCAAGSKSERDGFTDPSATEPEDEDASSSSSAPEDPGFVEAGVDTGVGQGTTCKRTLTMGKITSQTNPSCYINEEVSNRSADLEYDCATGGKAEITFGTQKFEGTIKSDAVDLTNVEQFDFGGCLWESTQRIYGDLSTKKVDYTYKEKPLQSCPNQYPCTADASFSVSATDEEVVR